MTINVLSALQLRSEREDIIMSAWKPLYFACETMQNNDVQWNTKLLPWKMKVLRNFHFANKGPCRIGFFSGSKWSKFSLGTENWVEPGRITDQFFWIIYLLFFWNNNSMLAYRVVCCSHQSDRLVYLSRTNQIAALGYVSRTNQIAALGYVSRTNHIIAFEYPAPITAFGYCFLLNDVMVQRMTLIRNYGLIW